LSFSIPASHLNPHVSGFFIVKYSGFTVSFLLSSSPAFLAVFWLGSSASALRVFQVSIASGVANVFSKAFVISQAFATEASIFLRASEKSHFQSFSTTFLNSGVVVTA